MNYVVPVIRFYLLWLAVGCLSTLHPECGIILLGSGFGWWPGCGCCGGGDCTYCDPDMDFTRQFQLDVSGIADGGTCTSCSSLNLTYVLDPLSIDDGGQQRCIWQTTHAAVAVTCGGFSSGTLTIQFYIDGNGGTYTAQGSITGHCSNATLFWVNSLGGTSPDCGAYSGESLATKSASNCGGIGTAGCSNSASTMLATAL